MKSSPRDLRRRKIHSSLQERAEVLDKLKVQPEVVTEEATEASTEEVEAVAAVINRLDAI